jgi:hypothetical protein
MKDRRPIIRKRARKVTSEIRHQLIQVHLHLGYDASRPLCIEHGVSRDYAAKQAFEHGVGERFKPRGGGDIALTVDHADPRWAIAIERGAVIA